MLQPNCQIRILTALCLTTLVTLSGSFLLPAQAGNSARDSSAEGLPGRRVGAGSRGCGSSDRVFVNPKELIALVPQNNIGTTATDSPTLFFHLPQLTVEKTVEFVLLDDRDQQLYETTFSAPANPSGVMSVTLPTKALPMEVGKNYHWYLSIICNADDRAGDIVVDGWLQRVPLDRSVAQQLAKLSPLEQAELYTANGLWQEALTTLATLRRDRPQDATIAARWQQLLQTFGLEAIAQAPILNDPSSENMAVNSSPTRN